VVAAAARPSAVDATPLGTDTSAPYQLTWNTRKASLTQHTLTAAEVVELPATSVAAAVMVTIVK
jgi:hypothetical protein